MYRLGDEEINAIAKVIRSRKLFRYDEDSECIRFEKRYAQYLGVAEALMTSSGTSALVAALGGLGVGPGDEGSSRPTPIWRPRWRCCRWGRYR